MIVHSTGVIITTLSNVDLKTKKIITIATSKRLKFTRNLKIDEKLKRMLDRVDRG